MNKPTPGPWTASPSNHVYSPAGELIADAGGSDTLGHDDIEANAALIVAAVNACHSINPDNPLAVAEGMGELIAACEGILNNLWKDRKRNVKRDYSLMLYEAQAQAAIRKARGTE